MLPALLAATSLTVPPSDGLPDARALVERVLEHRPCVIEEAERYTYKVRETKFDVRRARGSRPPRLGKDEERLWQVFPAFPRPLRRLLERDGRPLAPDEERREDERVARGLRAKPERGTRRSEDDLKLGEVLAACRLESVERTEVDGRPVVVVEVRGDPSFRPRSPSQKIARHLHGHLWIDPEDLQVVRAEASVGKVRFLGGLAAVLDEASLVFEQERVDGRVWLPAYSEIRYRGRLYLFHRVDRLETARFYEYRRFDTRVEVSYGAPVP
jgi:hypothetical protein